MGSMADGLEGSMASGIGWEGDAKLNLTSQALQ